MGVLLKVFREELCRLMGITLIKKIDLITRLSWIGFENFVPPPSFQKTYAGILYNQISAAGDG
jgi:hypothetical protein